MKQVDERKIEADFQSQAFEKKQERAATPAGALDASLSLPQAPLQGVMAQNGGEEF